MKLDTVTISKKEYTMLKRAAVAYRRIASRVFESAVKDDVSGVIDDFRKTELYTDQFLNDLEAGLKKSSYGKV